MLLLSNSSIIICIQVFVTLSSLAIQYWMEFAKQSQVEATWLTMPVMGWQRSQEHLGGEDVESVHPVPDTHQLQRRSYSKCGINVSKWT